MDSQVLEGKLKSSASIHFSPLLFLEPYDQQDLNEYFLLDTSQSSQNTVPNPIADVNFSSSND
jgi:hypothetical protein